MFDNVKYNRGNLKPHLTQNEQKNEEARDFEKSINSKSAAIFY
jgi:hypothetical protein